MKNVLILCSGNYYRSRFAEILFNRLASRLAPGWRAESRGFRLSPKNVGPISAHAILGLRARGIPAPGPHRFPMVVEAADFEAFDHVVAVKEDEHRQKMLDRFPAWAERIEYWRIDDIDCAQPDVALVELEGQIRRLIEQLPKP